MNGFTGDTPLFKRGYDHIIQKEIGIQDDLQFGKKVEKLSRTWSEINTGGEVDRILKSHRLVNSTDAEKSGGYNISMITVRGKDGKIVVFDPIQNKYENNILRSSIIGSSDLQIEHIEKLKQRAFEEIEKLKMVGVLTLDMRISNTGEIVVDYMTPKIDAIGLGTMVSATKSHISLLFESVLGNSIEDINCNKKSLVTHLRPNEILGISSFSLGGGSAMSVEFMGSDRYYYGKKNKTSGFDSTGAVLERDTNKSRLGF